MAVQFILGEYPEQKRKILIDQIYDQLQKQPEERILYLVPDNVKYEAETMILEQFMEKDEKAQYSGMIRLQVFSFSRLAWYLLQDQPIYQRPQLTESGLGMLMKRILEEEEQQLSIFRGASQEAGFIERLVTLFMELRNGRISPADLDEIASEHQTTDEITERDFHRKMNDLSLLYKKYDENLENKYIEKEDLYSELIKFIRRQKESFQNVSIVVDHYEHFSAQEQELLLELSKYTKQVMICLTVNAEAIHQKNDLNNPYYRSTKAYNQLQDQLQMQQIPLLDDLVLGVQDKKAERAHSEVLQLANYWMQSSTPTTVQQTEKYKERTYEDIELWAAEDKKTEIMHVATKIKRMVASGNYRYKDFQIMTRDLANYELNIEAVFEENDLPFFMDQMDTMSQHPLLEFVVSLFTLKKRHYRLNDVFRFLRTELYCPEIDNGAEDAYSDIEEKNGDYEHAANTWREKVDIAENVALAYGYQGNAWVDNEEWQYARFELEGEFVQSDHELNIQEIANDVRQTFRKEIVPFIDQLDQVETNQELATLLYNFMIDRGVAHQIQHWRDQLSTNGRLEEARQHEQAWKTFVQLLDEFVEVLGDEPWDIDLFISLMETGFEQATFNMVPPAIDQVLITNFDLPKIQTKKVVFLIGLTDTQLPKIASNQSLLTDDDRELVDSTLSSDKYLATSEIESAANEPFAMYLAILQANEKIILSYPLINEESQENRMSPYLVRIQNAFSLKLRLKYANAASKDALNAIDYLEFIGSYEQTFGQLVTSLRHALDESEAPPVFWVDLFERIYNPNNFKQNRIIQSLSHKNIPVPLTDDLAEELYGKDLYLSVSQLETFYADPYSHFLLYGLRLKERQVQELSPLETGNFFHDALDLISRQVVSLNKDIAVITPQEITQITSDIFQLLIDSNKYRLAQSSNRMQFIFRQLASTVERMVWSIVHQAKRSKMRTNQTELLFGRLGPNEGIQGLSFPLKNEGQLYLRGKVDRIDTFKVDDQLYAGIVDYKSSTTNFNYQQMYYGLMLQMITYLDTVLTFSEDIFDQKAKGIGAFYSRVHNPFIDIQRTGQKDWEEELLKGFKFDGLIVDRQEVLEAVDTELEKSTSPIYPIRLKVNGNYSGDKILTEEEFQLLLRFNREKIIEAGNRILSGENMLKPFDDDRLFTPSIRGPYRAISQFDALLPENNYQEMKKINKKEFFNRLREKYTQNEETEGEN
jgi:ATP-dependent helicase/nuclease subunit B